MLQWTFVPQGAQCYNENICYRKAHNGKMKTFIIARRQNVFYPIMPLAATFYEHATPLGSIFTFPYRQAEYIFCINPGIAVFSIQRPTTTRSLVLSTKIKLVPFPTCM
jgi:hypothetical protein